MSNQGFSDIEKIKAYILGEIEELTPRAARRFELIRLAHKYNNAYQQDRNKVIKMLCLETEYDKAITERTAREIIRDAQEVFGDLEIFEREYQIQIAFSKLLEAMEAAKRAGDTKTYGSLVVKMNEFAHKLPKKRRENKRLPYLIMTNNPLVLGIKAATLPKMHQEILALSKDLVSPTILQEIKELSQITGEIIDIDFELNENEDENIGDW